ncbi:hypothetical protein A4X13_0g7244 [Tilletia indica]|uniref:Uncharacterized protein n=1 Tax=Tilletia indica TaxID=43049 RepID=A0A8T8SKT5_9BASI|nr:hypothetical protein A4X13_0g7244 [Tilletia indica]
MDEQDFWLRGDTISGLAASLQAHWNPKLTRTVNHGILGEINLAGKGGTKKDDYSLTIASHSNGSFLHGWMLRAMPGWFKRNVLVDPVCFRMWEGAVWIAFVYREWTSAIEFLLGYSVAREIVIILPFRSVAWTDSLFHYSLQHGQPLCIEGEGLQNVLRHAKINPKRLRHHAKPTRLLGSSRWETPLRHPTNEDDIETVLGDSAEYHHRLRGAEPHFHTAHAHAMTLQRCVSAYWAIKAIGFVF